MLPSKSPKKQTLTPQQQADAARMRGAVDRMYGQQSPTPQVMAGVRDAVRNATPTPRPTPVVQQPVRPSRPIVQQPSTRPPGLGTTGGPFNPSGGIKKTMKKGGKVSSASKRADGIATKGKTKGRMI